MKVHITVTEDAGAAPAAGPERQLSVAREAAANAGPAAAAGTEQAMPIDFFTTTEQAQSIRPSIRPSGSVMDGGEAPAWLAELVRLADAGEVARPGEESQEARQSSAGLTMDAGSAGPAPG
ncbi:hypothetical protein OG453_43415 [Streptomyces sp. NBC_01381]|uniref:hypothetical protein n=1 Tax=Streptomyces sp. NBC_01381 TaxID=2903845 RepID=UPI00224ECBC1|nr:hypothetical protein [Streptomyces sp. NBC_01381]MCX4673413.1 hypothetical protein [Streptomyces sp. NBC_01381]